MQRILARLGVITLVLVMVLSLAATTGAAPASTKYSTTPTGYDSADDVVYKFYSQSGKNVIANWGARGEDCVFLSSYVADYYPDGYDALASLAGGTGQSNAHNSALYNSLKKLMTDSHTFYTYYDGSKNVRDYYKYTDCLRNDVDIVSLIYRCYEETSEWNQGNLWNQEHCWPKSRLSTAQQIGDIMHLRPAHPSENSSRGNTAYGESGGYYNPGPSVRGDCARMMLYMYVRWGATSTMWGSSGVMENMTVLLKWMKEDPVDTWEMGRNDSVQSITGVRNVFVDYPELAWLLFGQEIPSDMVTPSGIAKNGSSGSGSDTPVTPPPATCAHTSTQLKNAKTASCTAEGYTGDTYCTSCGEKVKTGSKIAKTNHIPDLRNAKEATCQEDGYTGDTYCKICNTKTATGTVIPKGEHVPELRNAKQPTCQEDGYTGDTYCTVCNTKVSDGGILDALGHDSHIVKQLNPTCTKSGYSGDEVCKNCNETLTSGTSIPATGDHRYGIWRITKEATDFEAGLQERFCSCGASESEEIAPLVMPMTTLIAIIGGGVAAVVCCSTAIVVAVKKKKVN